MNSVTGKLISLTPVVTPGQLFRWLKLTEADCAGKLPAKAGCAGNFGVI